MEGGASRSRACHSRLPQGQQLDAGASNGAGTHVDSAVVSREEEDMLTRHVQSLHRTTERGLR